MSKPFSQWTDTDVAQHEQNVAAMKTARLHNVPVVGEVHLRHGASVSDDQAVEHGCSVSPKQLSPAGLTVDAHRSGSVPTNHTTHSWTIKIDAMGAPRMTRADAWRKRDVVLHYHAYKDALRAAIGDIPLVPDELHWIAYFAMPESWSIRKALKMCGQPHRQKPDRDNIDKGLMDALFMQDQGVWKGSQQKLWTDRSEGGRIELTMIWHQPLKLDPQPQP